MASLLELNGAAPQLQPRYRPIFMDRSFTGLFTQRAVVHDPADIYTSKFYGGRPDALWAGLNIELTNRLTLSRRPGLSPFTTTGTPGFVYPTAPNTSYSFQCIDGTIRVMVDTGSTGPSEQDTLTGVTGPAAGGTTSVYAGTFASGANNGLVGFYVTVAGFVNGGNNGVFPVVASTATSITVTNASGVTETHAGTATTLLITSVANASGGTTVYTGTITGGGSNAYANLKFTIAGFSNGVNNGTFVCTASTTTTITLKNALGVSETPGTPATIVSTGAVYWDQQNGSAVMIFAKTAGAGQTYFIGSGGILFFADGVDNQKYTPFNNNNGSVADGSTGNGSVWLWGIVAPISQPSVNIVASGSASSKWRASTVFSTMGLTYDAMNHQMWQLIGVNASPVLNPNTTNAIFGQAGVGGPAWNNTLSGRETTYGTTPDNGGTWQNISLITQWTPQVVYGDAGVNKTASNVCIYDPITNAYYLNFKGGGALSRSGNKKPPFTATVGWNFTEQGSDGAGGNGFFAPHWFFFATAAQMQPWKTATGYTAWYSGSHAVGDSVIEPFIVPPSFTPVNGNPPTDTFLQVPLGNFTSGASASPFPATPSVGQQLGDNQLLWQCVSSSGSGSTDALWHASTKFVPWTVPGSTFSAIFDGTNIQVCVGSTGNGLSGTLQPGTAIASAQSITVAANTPSSGQATYTLGAGSWTHIPNTGDQIAFSGFTNAGNNTGGSNPFTFTVISATSNTIVVANASAVNETNSATATLNPWGVNYSNTTQDGNITWACVGPSVAWAANAFWNLPLTGFAPPQQTQKYGGSTILGTSNQTVQTVISSGTSGAPTEPTWNAVGSNTTDNTITWYAESTVLTNSLAFAKGYSYAYSYKARSLDDIYSAPPLGGINGIQQIPPGQTAFLTTPPPGSQTNAVSTASPANNQIGSNGGAVLNVSGAYSSDPQVDTIIIWRSLDGGGPNQMFELTEINNVVGGGTWTFQDFLPDTPTSTQPGVNTNIPAPINGVNNPPVAGFLPQVYNFQRIWGADGQYAAFSGGPDTEVGNPDEAFLLSDRLPFLAPVTRIVKSAQGLVTFLTDSIEVIIGGPVTSSFSSVTWAPGIGLIDYNALDQFAGEIYFFSADNQFRVMTPSLNIQNAGFAIADQFANLPTSGTMSNGLTIQSWAPKKAYVASHQSTIDNAIFVADGNVGWYRLNPRQSGALPNTEPVWSPFAQITNGCKMVQSIEVAPGIKKLLVGSSLPGKPILQRDLTVYQDNGSSYDAFFEMGNITLAHPGQLALLKFLEMDFNGVNFLPTVSYLLNEIAGTFTPFTANPVFDPPQIYGATISPTSYSPNRYYFSGNASLARCRHMRIKIDYGTGNSGNELFNLTIYGRLMVEM